ncbi:hypothetical protein BH10BAC5_BH10BAC5_29030 [soil metagenome]
MKEINIENRISQDGKTKNSLSNIKNFIDFYIPVKNMFNEKVLCEALEHYSFLSNYASKTVHTNSATTAQGVFEESYDLHSRLCSMISTYYYSISSYEKSQDFALKKLEIDKEANNYLGIAKSYTILGNIFTDLGDLDQAVDFHLKALRIAKSNASQDVIGVTYTNLGNIEVHKKNYDKALEYYTKANEILSSYERLKIQLATNLHNLGIVYFYTEDLDKSYEFYLQSRVLRNETNDKRGQGQTTSNIAILLEKKGNDAAALNEINSAIEIQKEINDRSGLFYSYIMKSRLLFKKENKAEAMSLIDSASKIANEINSDVLTSIIYENKYDIHSTAGEWEEALVNYEKYYEVNKIIYNQKKERKTSNLLLLYELDEAKNEAEGNDKIFKSLSEAVKELSKMNKKLADLTQEKNEILNVASHDLRNPLSNIKILTEFLQKGETNSLLEEKEFFRMISKSSENMLSMISDLLNINLLENSTYELKNTSFNISDLINDLVSIYKIKAETKNIIIELTIQKDAGNIFTDRIKLGQIIDNLLSNAVKFSPAGKKILINVTEKNKEFYISVKDEGPGFSEADLKKVFNKFSKLSARPTGGEDSTGLGLFIIKKLIELLKGSIKIDSNKNEGAEIIIKIPSS